MLIVELALVAACDRPGDNPNHETARAAIAVPDAAAARVTVADASLVPEVDAAPGAELVITPWAPRPGSSSMVTFDAKLDFDLNFGGLEIITSTTQSKKKKVQILAVDPDGIVHKRIRYIKRDTNAVVDGERKKDPSPIRGKTYDVTTNFGVVDVRLPGGRRASEEEVEAVRRDEGQLQSPEMLGKVLVGLRLVEGQSFEVPVAALEKLVVGDFRARRMVLTYRGKTRDGTRVDAVGMIASDGAGLKLFLDLDAELLLDPTGWCLSAKVDGKVRAELNGTVVGSGAGTGTVAATPLR